MYFRNCKIFYKLYTVYFFILGTKGVNKTRLTSIHTEKLTTAFIETDFVSKDALWLVSIVKLLGYTLGISLLIILGLVCLFLCKRRREFEALNISQPNEQDFRLLNYFNHRNVDCVASNINSRNNINISEVSQGHFEISRVGRTDDRSRKKFVGKSRNAYVDQVSQETGRHSPVELPAYLEVLP